MRRKSGLGRGLDALIPPAESQLPASGVTQVPIDNIQTNPRQPRGQADQEALAELAASIRQHGVLQPLILTQGEAEGQYVLIAGERRLRASKLAGLQQVPAILREASDQQLLELALIENVQRADLSPLEEAQAYKQLNETFGLTHEQIAERVGKGRPTVTNTIGLLDLPAKVREALAEGLISGSQARTLKGLPSKESQLLALQTIIERGYNARKTEELVQEMKGQKAIKPGRKKVARSNPPEIREIEERLRKTFIAPVNLKYGPKGGTITIRFFSDEELNSIVEHFLGESD